MDAIVTEFLNSDLCESLGNDPRCPDIIDAVLRNGLPLLAADEYANGDFEKVSKNKKRAVQHTICTILLRPAMLRNLAPVLQEE